MGNEHNDAKTWADGVETYPATAQDLADYERSRHALAQFQAPLLVNQHNPHTRLFVACFDGTGNDKYKDPEHITNIGILSDQVYAANKANVRNIGGYYVPGVGTQDDALPRNLDGGLGYSYGPRMEEMYLKFIRQAKQWHDEDPQAKISIVSTGFSRGAVTAAMFTRMVHERGIQNPKDMNIEKGPHGEILKLTPTHPPLVPPGRTPQAVGLLDPVATGEMNLRDTRLPPSVVSGLQITARDERRDLFPVKDIIDPGRSPDGRLLNLVNPGAHSDIGGSYRLDGLSVRNGNLLTDYVNTLSDKPFLQPRTVSTAPEMNVIHRSEQHQSFYTTAMAATLGQRVHVKDLAGMAMSLNRTDAESLDAGLRAHLPLRPVAVSPERTDPSLPAFFREGSHPHALAAPPLPAYLQQAAPPHAGQPAQAAPQASDLRDPSHPGHAEFSKTLREVRYMEAGQGIASGPHSEKVAAALLVQGEREGLRITNVAMGADGKVQGLQRLSAFDTPKTVTIDPRQAQSVEMRDYANQWAQLRSPHLVSQAAPAERTADQAQGLAALSAADQAMFARIRQDVPAHIGDDHVAQAMLAAKQAGIADAEKIDRVLMAGNALWVAGTTPGFRVETDVAQPAMPIQDTAQQAQAFNQQREQQLAMEAQQRQQEGPGGRGGPAMS